MQQLTPIIQVLVHQSSSNEWSQHSLELLGDASTLARRIGAKTQAWIASPFPPDAAIENLANFGCDSVLRIHSPEPTAKLLAESLPEETKLIFLPGDALGEELAALLAGHLAATWIPDVLSLSVTRNGAIEITTVLAEGRLARSFRTEENKPTIVTLREGVAEVKKERPAAKSFFISDFISTKKQELPTKNLLEKIPADPKTQDITLARRIVAGGRGVQGRPGMQLMEQLGESLGASLAASRVAVDLGWAPYDRQVGQTGKSVKPDLYVACGISGASHHLAGMRESKHIIAINSDAKAPIHEVATLSLRANLHEVVPAIQNILQRRKENAGNT